MTVSVSRSREVELPLMVYIIPMSIRLPSLWELLQVSLNMSEHRLGLIVHGIVLKALNHTSTQDTSIVEAY